MSHKSKGNHFVILRKDCNFEANNINDIYDLTFLNKAKYSEEQKESLLKTIKKMIIGTNFNSIQMIRRGIGSLIFFHSILTLCCVIWGLVNNKSPKEIFKNFLLLNLILIPEWFLVLYFRFFTSKKKQKIFNKVGKYILNYQTKTNNYFKYEIEQDAFHIKVSEKKSDVIEDIQNEDNNFIFSYFVSVVFEALDVKDILHEKLIPKDDLEIAKVLISFLVKESVYKPEVLAPGPLIPLAILGWFCFFGEQTKYYWTTCISLIFVSYALLILKQQIKGKRIKSKLEELIDKINNENIEKGKFLYKYSSMVVIGNLTDKGKTYNKKQLTNYFDKLIDL